MPCKVIWPLICLGLNVLSFIGAYFLSVFNMVDLEDVATRATKQTFCRASLQIGENRETTLIIDRESAEVGKR